MPRTRQASSAAVTSRKKRRRQPNKQTGMAILLSTAMVLVGILLYLWPQMRLVNLGYHQGRLQVRRTQALRRQKELRLEFATLRQLSRIEAIAMRRLRLRPPQMSQIIYVHAGQRILQSGDAR